MVAVPYRRIGTTYRSHLQGSNLKMGPMVVPKCPSGITTIHGVISQKSADLEYSISSLSSFDHLLIVLQTAALISNR